MPNTRNVHDWCQIPNKLNSTVYAKGHHRNFPSNGRSNHVDHFGLLTPTWCGEDVALQIRYSWKE